jgi:hypothetical protein
LSTPGDAATVTEVQDAAADAPKPLGDVRVEARSSESTAGDAATVAASENVATCVVVRAAVGGDDDVDAAVAVARTGKR